MLCSFIRRCPIRMACTYISLIQIYQHSERTPFFRYEFVFFVYLIPYAFLYLKATIESGQVSPACGLPMYYVQSAPFVCFIITAFRIAQRWFGEWRIVLNREKKPLEEGDIASVIEEAVVEDTFREKELAELEKEEGGEK